MKGASRICSFSDFFCQYFSFPAFPFLHRSLQYFTSSHTFSHFFRHEKGRPQVAHTFCGRSVFLICFAITEKEIAVGAKKYFSQNLFLKTNSFNFVA